MLLRRLLPREGARQTFENLVFRGGAGETLEMRVFSEPSLIEEFGRAGFAQVRIRREADPRHGIYRHEDWPPPISAGAD